MINRLSRYINKFITKLDIQVSGSSKLFHLPGMIGSDSFKESFLKVTHHVYRKLIKKTFAVHFKQSDLVLNRQWLIFCLLHQLYRSLTPLQLLLRRCIKVTAKLGKSFEFTILCQIQF